jgi:hypothetical protein
MALTCTDSLVCKAILSPRRETMVEQTNGPRRCANTGIQGPDRSSILEEVIG